jgi:ABC-type transporter Mla MlaB component
MSATTPVHRLAVEQDLTIYHAAQHKLDWLTALDACEVLELDLAGVGEVDTSGVQLLLMIKQEAARQNKRAPIVAHSAAVQEVIDFCNLAARLGDPILIPA